jgi:hypothetical protein
MCQLALGHYFLNTGLPPYRIWFTSDGFAEALVTLQRRYRFDGILVNIPGRPENLLDDVTSIENAPDGQRITWRDRGTTILPWDDNAYHLMPDGSRPPRADFEKLDRTSSISSTAYRIRLGRVSRAMAGGQGFSRPTRRDPDYFVRTIDLVRTLVGVKSQSMERCFLHSPILWS